MASIALVEKVSSRTDFIRHFENEFYSARASEKIRKK